MTTVETTDTTAATRGYVSLHTHTEFSAQDGLARLSKLVDSVVADGQPAVSMTDHGNFAGAWKFVNECISRGVKPILGEEFYVALVPDESIDLDAVEIPGHIKRAAEDTPRWLRPEVRFARFARQGMDAETGKAKRQTNNHLTVLAATTEGWRNLCQLANKAEESFYGKPLIDYALLKEHSEGLIVLSGCLGGPVASHVAAARTDVVGPDGTITATWDEAKLDEAREGLRRLIECVGRENVYVEIMEHGLGAEGWEHIKMLATLGREQGVDVVATNDSHYVDACDCSAHDAWLVVGEIQRKNNITVHTEDRWRFNGSGYWMRTEAEMRAIYPDKAGWQRAVDNTVAIAERIQGVDDAHPYGVIPFKPLRLPRYPVPQDYQQRWEAGQESVFVGTDGKEYPARLVDGKAYRSSSAYYVHDLVLEGAKKRYGSLRDRPDARERFRFEEDVIFTLGLEDYFLIVSDVINWCRSDRGLPNTEFPEGEPGKKKPILVGPGRGSAAGSIYSYALSIVMVDPLENMLLFERFLDVERVGMPDIDVDFEAARRDEVYDYLAAKYGRDYVARIGAFQNAKTKRAIKDSARALGYSNKLADELAKLVPVKQGQPHTFAMIFEEVLDKETGQPVPNPEAGPFRAAVADDPNAQKIVELARAIEGVSAGVGIHAAGVIISDEPLPSLLPMRLYRKEGKLVSEVPIALWDGVDIDAFGMLKLDALGLTNLDIVAAAVEHIKNTTGEIVDPDALPHPNDLSQRKVAAAYELLREGRTQGVFQLASDGITNLIKAVAPTEFSDLSATLALYRPGPMGADMHIMYADRKNGRAPVDYSIYSKDTAEQESIAKILGDTFGTIVYQEQMMALAYEVADFDAAERNKLRKAVSKKKQKEIDALKVIFMSKGQAAVRSDGTPKVAFQVSTLETIWVTFNAAAAYLFNKSHTVAYGQLSYVTSYLKAAWPTAYGAGLLSTIDDNKKRLPALKSLAVEGITVDAPDVNASQARSAPDPDRDGVVRLGLSEIRDVGNNAQWIITERDANGPFASMADLIARVKVPGKDKEGNPTLGRIGALAIEGLIEAGAFDAFGPRLGHMMIARAAGDCPDIEVPDCEWGSLERANRQRHRLQVTTGPSVLDIYADDLNAHRIRKSWNMDDPEMNMSKAPVFVDDIITHNQVGVQHVTGLLTDWAPKLTKKGQMMARFTLQGTHDSIDGIVFPNTLSAWAEEGIDPQVGDIVTFTGDVRKSSITVTKMMQIENEDGEIEEVEQEREIEKTELIASGAKKVDVDNLPRHAFTVPVAAFNLPEGSTDFPEMLADEMIGELAEMAKSLVEAFADFKPKTTTPPAAPDPDVVDLASKKAAKTAKATDETGGADATSSNESTAAATPTPTPAAPKPLRSKVIAVPSGDGVLWFRHPKNTGGLNVLSGSKSCEEYVRKFALAPWQDPTMENLAKARRLMMTVVASDWTSIIRVRSCTCDLSEPAMDEETGGPRPRLCLGCPDEFLYLIRAKNEEMARAIATQQSLPGYAYDLDFDALDKLRGGDINRPDFAAAPHLFSRIQVHLLPTGSEEIQQAAALVRRANEAAASLPATATAAQQEQRVLVDAMAAD